MTDSSFTIQDQINVFDLKANSILRALVSSKTQKIKQYIKEKREIKRGQFINLFMYTYVHSFCANGKYQWSKKIYKKQII